MKRRRRNNVLYRLSELKACVSACSGRKLDWSSLFSFVCLYRLFSPNFLIIQTRIPAKWTHQQQTKHTPKIAYSLLIPAPSCRRRSSLPYEEEPPNCHAGTPRLWKTDADCPLHVTHTEESNKSHRACWSTRLRPSTAADEYPSTS